MCMKCGCSTPNDKKVAPPIVATNGGSAKDGIIVKPTDATPGGYDY